ncbi:family 10 glycosylhydrolase [Cyanobium sp. Morenito 9A2]|uniref:family 10 glycosylhydrolase n=1 Tax=Cyanobium sp. Morenito 9A2 TaxID=2823718 RepID=UPI0020CD015A|nr:family 10 glycosylhydrolase [Cyanobium sp. Morenito 9A2]
MSLGRRTAGLLSPWPLLAALAFVFGGAEAIVGSAAAQPIPPQPPFDRRREGPADSLGVWLTTVDSAVMFDPEAAARAVELFARQGVTRVAVPIYTGGYAYWPVTTTSNPLQLAVDPRLGDPLAPTRLLRDLRQKGLQTVGWMEFGLMAPIDAPWLIGRQGLLLQDLNGQVRWSESPGLDRVWLNPALPEVRRALVALAVEACRRLPLDALQFDDHLGYPARFGYDPATLALWRATPAGRLKPQPTADDPTWLRWRAGLVTALLAEIRQGMAKACPGVALSVSPNPMPFSLEAYLADWPSWVSAGLVDEVVVQIYRRDLGALQGELERPSLQQAALRVPLRIGLLAGLKSAPKDPQLLQQELELVRQRGWSGIDLFFYETALPYLLRPTPAPTPGAESRPSP